MTAACVRCDRPMPDVAYCCPSCVAVAAENLSRVTEYTPAARDVAQGQSRRGGGGGSGKPGSRLPLDLTATAKLDGVQRELTRWVDWIGTQRGATRPWFTQTGDEIVIACRWLADHLEWMRHQPNREPDRDGRTWGADEFLTDVEAAARVMRSVARGPAEMKYLGPCGALRHCEGLEPDDWPEGDCGDHLPHAAHDRDPCDGDVYGRAGADKGRCKTCGAQVDQGERQIWLDEVRRDWAFTAREIADAYQVNVKTIRSWALRGTLASYWRTEAGLVTPWVDPALDPDLTGEELKERLGEISDEIQARGGRLHYVGDVLDLAAGDAARREEARAARARRLEQQRSGGQAA